jgi:hypothetical protein
MATNVVILLPNVIDSNNNSYNYPFSLDSGVNYYPGTYQLVFTNLGNGLVFEPPFFSKVINSTTDIFDFGTQTGVQIRQMLGNFYVGVYSISITYVASQGYSGNYITFTKLRLFDDQVQSQIYMTPSYISSQIPVTTIDFSFYQNAPTSTFFNTGQYIVNLYIQLNPNPVYSDTFQNTQSGLNVLDVSLNGLNINSPTDFYVELLLDSSPLGIQNPGLQANVFCYLHGTKILLEDRTYVAIENLKIGQKLHTFKDGSLSIKYIAKRKMTFSKSNNDLKKLYVYKKGDVQSSELSPLPFEDLVVTGGHSLLVDTLDPLSMQKLHKYWGKKTPKIHDKFLLLSCCSSECSVYDKEGEFYIYQIVLDTEDSSKQFGIYANGVLSETMSLDFYKNNFKA